jgi:ATP synthase mitochondrial F1 complex assembly factor 2
MEGVMFAKHGKGSCHPPQLVQACATWIQSLDAWHLTALYNMCTDTKGFMISSALLMASHTKHSSSSISSIGSSSSDRSSSGDDSHTLPHHHWTLNIVQALAAARVEEEFNIEHWGLVEGGHDYDRLNTSIQITSASLVSYYMAMLLNEHEQEE